MVFLKCELCLKTKPLPSCKCMLCIIYLYWCRDVLHSNTWAVGICLPSFFILCNLRKTSFFPRINPDCSLDILLGLCSVTLCFCQSRELVRRRLKAANVLLKKFLSWVKVKVYIMSTKSTWSAYNEKWRSIQRIRFISRV